MGANLPNAFLHTVGAKWGGKERKSLNEDGGGRNAIKGGVAFIVREETKEGSLLVWDLEEDAQLRILVH